MKNQEVSNQEEETNPKAEREYLNKRAEAFGYIDKAENFLYELKIDENEVSQVNKRNELRKKTKIIHAEYLGTRRNPKKLEKVIEKVKKLDAEVEEFSKYVSSWETLAEKDKLEAKKVKKTRKRVASRRSGGENNSEQEKEPGSIKMSDNKEDASPDIEPVVAKVDDLATGQEEINPTRAAAWHTIRKFKDLPASSNRTYTELNAKTAEERSEKFKALTRELWNEFAVHGIARFDEKTGKLYVEKRSDLDGESFLKIMELAGMSVERSKVKFVAPGEATNSGVVGDTSGKDGVIAENDGKLLTFDHHAPTSTRDTSATKYLYKTLVKLKFFDDDQRACLDKYVSFVTKFDNVNFTPEEEGEVYANYHKNLYGLASKMKLEDILELIKQGTDPNKSLPDSYLESHTFINPKNGREETLASFSNHIKEQSRKGEKEISRLGEKGFVLETGDDRFGKVLIDTMKKGDKDRWYSKISGENASKQLATFQRGYGALVTWSPQENKFYVSTKREMNEESIPGGFSQGLNVRGHLLTNGGGNGKAVRPDFLQEILGKLAGKEDFQIEGTLKKAIELDEKSKELLDLFDKNSLTENDLRKTAAETGVLLKDLLEAMISQRDKLSAKIEKRIKKLPQKPSPNRDRVTMDFLLERQKNTQEAVEDKAIAEVENQELSEKELKFMAEYEKDAKYMLQFITEIDYVGRCGYKKEAVADAIKAETERYWKLFEQEMLGEGFFKDAKRVVQVIEKIRSNLESAPKRSGKKLKEKEISSTVEVTPKTASVGQSPERIFDIRNIEQQIEMIKEGKVYYAELLGREKNLETAFTEFEKNNRELLESYKDKDILLKVNLVDPDSSQACTDPKTIKKIIEMISKYGPKKIYVGDIPSAMGKKGRNWDDLQKIYKSKLGYDFGSTAELINLEELENETIKVGDESFETKRLDKFGGIINISRPKMHGEFGFTGCTKNLMGFMTQGTRDASIHMHKDIADGKSYVTQEANRRLGKFSEAMLKNRPDMINITDGTDFVIGHEHLGVPKKTDFALVSRDPFNSDHEMLKLLGLNKARVTYLENETFARIDGKLSGLMSRSEICPSGLEKKLMLYDVKPSGRASFVDVINDSEFINSPEIKKRYIASCMKLLEGAFISQTKAAHDRTRRLADMRNFIKGKNTEEFFNTLFSNKSHRVFRESNPYNNNNFPEFERMAIQWINNQTI